MKRLFIAIVTVTFVLVSGCSIESTKRTSDSTKMLEVGETTTPVTSMNETTTAVVTYKDGIYEAKTGVDGEGYYTQAKIEIKDGKIISVDWKIVDDVRKRDFDDTYEEVFIGNEAYINQSRGDMIGVNSYGPLLIEAQKLSDVDAISGATWSYGKFKSVIHKVLQEAAE